MILLISLQNNLIQIKPNIIIQSREQLMKSLSSSKKRKSATTLNDTPKYLQSRLYIPSSQINPLSQSIASKLNIIKQQISREFNQKYTEKLIDKKLKCLSRCDSLKKSTSISRITSKKSKSKQYLLQPKRLFQDQNQNFNGISSHQISRYQSKSKLSTTYKEKQKYSNLNQNLLDEKQKFIQYGQYLVCIKTIVQKFIISPSQDTANNLVTLLNSLGLINQQFRLQSKNIFMQSLHNLIQSKEQFNFMKQSMERILNITQKSSIQQLQALLLQLKRSKYPSNSHSVDHLSYRILELQANNNRIKNQYEQIIKDIQQKYELMLLEQKQERQKQSNQFNFLINRLQSEIQQYSTRQTYMNSDLIKLYEHYSTRPLQEKSLKFLQFQRTFSENKFATPNRSNNNDQNSSLTTIQFKTDPTPESIEQIHQLLKQMSHKLAQIRVQAEQNKQKLQQSNEQMKKLDSKLQQLVSQMQEQINEGILQLSLKNKKLQQTTEQIIKLQKQLNEQKLNISTKQKEILNIEANLDEKNILIKQKQIAIISKDHEITQFKKLWQIQNNKFALNLKEKDITNQSLKEQNHKLIQKTQRFIKQKHHIWNLIKQFQVNLNISGNVDKQNTKSQSKKKMQTNSNENQIEVQLLSEYLKMKTQHYKNQYQSLSHLLKQKQSKIKNCQLELNKFSQSIQNFHEENQILKKQYKSAKIQKDQYEYLLKSTRQEFRLAKKKHETQMKKLQREKDEELLVSNKTILEANSDLTHQNIQIKAQNSRLNKLLQENINERTFYKKKTHQSDSLLVQKDKKIGQLQRQIMKYKTNLDQIQQSFNQVVKNEQISSQKLINLQQQKKSIAQQIKLIKQKNENLDRQNDRYREKFNTQVMKTQSLQAKIKELITNKEKYQQANIQLRMGIIQVKQHKEIFEEQNKHLKREKQVLEQHNQNLSKDLNKLMSQMTKILSQKQNIKTLHLQIDQKQQQIKRLNLKSDKFQAQSKQNQSKIQQLQLQLQYQTQKYNKSVSEKEVELQRKIKDVQHQSSIYQKKIDQLQKQQNKISKQYEAILIKQQDIKQRQKVIEEKELRIKQENFNYQVRLQNIKKEEKRLVEVQNQLLQKQIDLKSIQNQLSKKGQLIQSFTKSVLINQVETQTIIFQQSIQKQSKKVFISTEMMTELTKQHLQQELRIKVQENEDIQKQFIRINQQLSKCISNDKIIEQQKQDMQRQKQFITNTLSSLQQKKQKLNLIQIKIQQKENEIQVKEISLQERQDKINQQQKEIMSHLQKIQNKRKFIESQQKNNIKLKQSTQKLLNEIKIIKENNEQNKIFLKKENQQIKKLMKKYYTQLLQIVQKIYQKELKIENMNKIHYKVYEPLIQKDFSQEENYQNNQNNTSIEHKKVRTEEEQLQQYSPHNNAQIYSGKIMSIPSLHQTETYLTQNVIKKVNEVLQLLIEDIEEPQIAIFQSIKINYNILKKKIKRVVPSLQLDISSVEHKGSLCSPTSLSFCKDFLFDRKITSARVNSQPQQILINDQNSSQRGSQLRKTQKAQFSHIKKCNQYLQEVVKQYEQKNEYLKNKNLQLEQRMVLLQNQTSIKALQNTFRKLIDSYIQDNLELFQQTCRLLMKLELELEINSAIEQIQKSFTFFSFFFDSVFVFLQLFFENYFVLLLKFSHNFLFSFYMFDKFQYQTRLQFMFNNFQYQT